MTSLAGGWNQLINLFRCTDIKLKVKGIKTLYDSFRDYTAVKTLDYQAEGFGQQDARNGIIFQSFPPVLHLLLRRYEYDVQCNTMIKVRTPFFMSYGFGSKLSPKIDDPFKFPFEIDLGDFLDETADRTKPWKYRLHSVLVHSDDLHGGRYFALIKPDRYTRWLKFDDRRVTPVTDREALEENYGGEPLDGVVPRTQMNQDKTMRKFTRARMLVYIRETAIDEVLAPLTQEDVPPDLSEFALGWRLDTFSLSLSQDDGWMRNAPRWRRRELRGRNLTCS